MHNVPSSRVAINLCNGVSGVINSGPNGKILGIEPVLASSGAEKRKKAEKEFQISAIFSQLPGITNMITDEHYLFAMEDSMHALESAGYLGKCGSEKSSSDADNTNINSAAMPAVQTILQAVEFEQHERPIASTSDKPTKYIEYLVFNDHKRYTTLGQDTTASTKAIANNVNIVYANANFDVNVNVVFKGQITFVGADPYTKYWATE